MLATLVIAPVIGNCQDLIRWINHYSSYNPYRHKFFLAEKYSTNGRIQQTGKNYVKKTPKINKNGSKTVLPDPRGYFRPMHARTSPDSLTEGEISIKQISKFKLSSLLR